MVPTNPDARAHDFLAGMYRDAYFPNDVVDLARQVLVDLCEQIEAARPEDLDALYQLTHAATDQINDLQDAFEEADSEIETAAREEITADFRFVATAYGFADADVEELTATRDW